jgi:hypothetical protein
MANTHTTWFNIKKPNIAPTGRICVYRMILTINGDHFPEQY